jgi:hypothetical protein
MLTLLKEKLTAEGIAFCYLDGSTANRAAVVEKFQADAAIPVFLISLKAGGTGLNLTGADTVIHFDPWWNPAVEDQATDRAHRIGQTRTVTSYKLITRDTVEEYLNIQGVLFKLIDTAGIRSSTTDSIEQMGIEKSKGKILGADIVIALFDINDPEVIKQVEVWKTEVDTEKLILVGNKKDLLTDHIILNNAALKDVLIISAKEKENIKALEDLLFQKVVGDGIHKEGTIITNARHVASLKKLMMALNDVETGLQNDISDRRRRFYWKQLC